jgi:hypothetical protein
MAMLYVTEERKQAVLERLAAGNEKKMDEQDLKKKMTSGVNWRKAPLNSTRSVSRAR